MLAIKLPLQCPLHSGSPHLDILAALLKPVCNCLKGALCARGPSLYKRTGFSQTSCFLYKISFHKDGECFMGFSGKFYILHCPSKVYLTSLMGKWMRVVEVSTFQLLLMNLTKLCTNFISTPQRTLPQLCFFSDKTFTGKVNPFRFLCFTFPFRCVTHFCHFSFSR